MDKIIVLGTGITGLMAGIKEILKEKASAIGYMTTQRLTYDPSESLMDTDLVRVDNGLVSAYSSSFSCAGAVAVKLTELIGKAAGINNTSKIRSYTLERREINVEKF